MNVVDIGCCAWGEDNSVDKLIERFAPPVLYGFDPYPEVNDGVQMIRGTKVKIRNQAAWTSDGKLHFNPLSTGTHRLEGETQDSFEAECFDLAAWLLRSFGDPVVLKMDCEGAEFSLIPHLTSTGAFSRVGLLLVEFHGDAVRPPIPVPWEPW